MARDYCIRNVSDDVHDLVESECRRREMSRTSCVQEMLREAAGVYRVPKIWDHLERATKVVPQSLPFKFVDLFAGIGGFRIALTKLGGECVWSCEYDKFARQTYCEWFRESGNSVFGDINELRSDKDIQKTIPDHDILAAGFPCQPFSLAGVSKKNSLGRAHGFNCEKQGNLFFKIRDIVRVKRPPVLFLENVKNLKSHDKGKTWEVIRSTLTDELGYKVYEKVIDGSTWVPQHRERILIVCFDRKEFGDDIPFDFPAVLSGEKPVLGELLDKNPPEKYVLTDHLWRYLQSYAEKHRAKGNGFGYGLVGPGDQTRTLSARYHKDGSEILIRAPKGGHRNVSNQKKNKMNPRRLTIREAARLMGFSDEDARFFGHPEGFPQVVSDTQAYRQFGNAVVPAMVEAVGYEILAALASHLQQRGNGCLLKHSGDEDSKAAGVRMNHGGRTHARTA